MYGTRDILFRVSRIETHFRDESVVSGRYIRFMHTKHQFSQNKMLILPGFNKITVHLIKPIYARFYTCFSIINLDYISLRSATRLTTLKILFPTRYAFF